MGLKIVGEFGRVMGRTMVREQTRAMPERYVGHAGGRESAVEGIRHVGASQGRAQRPGEHVARFELEAMRRADE